MKNVAFFGLLALIGLAAVSAVRGNVYENWARQFGTAATDKALAVSTDSSAVYVVGQTQGALSGQILTGYQDAFITKYSTAGATMWTRQFGATSSDLASGVAVTGSGVYVAGQFGGSAFVRKYDLDGNELWTREFGFVYINTTGGKMVVSADSTGVYVAGFQDGTLPGQTSAGNTDAFVRKYDLDGNQVWTRQFGGPGDDLATGVSVSSTGVYVCGVTEELLRPSLNIYDGFVRKYDFSGTEIWTDQFGDALGVHYAQAITADPSGIYVAGSNEFGSRMGLPSPALVRKYDSDGGVIWHREFFASSTPQVWDTAAEGISVDSSGVYVTGLAKFGYSVGTPLDNEANDAFVTKFNVDGQRLWTRFIGTPTHDRANGVAVDPVVHDVYVVGDTKGVLGCQPVTRSQGGFDAFLASVTERNYLSLAVEPLSVSVAPGQVTSRSDTALSIGHPCTPIDTVWDVSVSGLPSGAELLFCNEAEVCTPTIQLMGQTGVGIKIATCAIPPCSFTTPGGDYPVTITATSGSRVVNTTFTLTVYTPRQHLLYLIAQTGTLTLRSTSFLAKLEAALDQIDRENNEAAINQLQAFISEINALRGIAVGDANADKLVTIAERIKNSL